MLVYNIYVYYDAYKDGRTSSDDRQYSFSIVKNTLSLGIKMDLRLTVGDEYT